MSAKSKEARLLAQSLDETRQAMEAMRARQSAAEERNRIYRQLLDRFRSMIDAGTLDVSIERGRLVINLKQDILFGSGSSQVETVGEETLLEVASALSEFPNRMFQVEGHTDNVPIATARFPSNWELSTARATSVVKILIEGSVQPGNLSAAGYGEFQARAENDSDEGKAAKRDCEAWVEFASERLGDHQLIAQCQSETFTAASGVSPCRYVARIKWLGYPPS